MLAPVLLTSCFTGVEGTQTIRMSRKETKIAAPTPEEMFLSDIVTGVPLGEWKEGRRFYVSDDKIALLLLQRSLTDDISRQPHKGDILTFRGTEQEKHPDGSTTIVLCLEEDSSVYLYDTGRSAEEAFREYNTLQPEALIDMETINRLDKRLHDRTFWTRSSLWYDRDDEDFRGRKYVTVTVTAVTPGNMVFPVKITFRDESGTEGNYYMNLGDEKISTSRSFASLFYLEDLRKHYPQIDEEVWRLIQNGQVKEGMTKQECRLALGAPIDSESSRDYTSLRDYWKYDGGRYLVFENGLLVEFRI